MSRYLIVRSEEVPFDGGVTAVGGTVVNSIEADLSAATAYATSLNYTANSINYVHTPWIDAEGDIGGTYDDTGGYTVPPLVVRAPQTVSGWQVKRQLLAMISETDSVTPCLNLAEDYLNAIVNAAEKREKLLKWNEMPTWRRNEPLLAELMDGPLNADLGASFNEANIAAFFEQAEAW